MQLQLNLSAPAPASQDDVARLVRLLYEAGDRWLKAAQISKQLGCCDRKVRDLASNSGGMVISGPGCPGYKHVLHCDPEEIKTVTGRLEHQAKLMAARAGAMRAAFHKAAANRQDP